jgi:GT2 family glycosyltransferase/Tfp pilus assembly protein PilF
MPLRYLFGPVTRDHAEQNLHGPRRAGTCLAFNAEGDADLRIQPGDRWEDIRGRLPAGWEPDFVALDVAYTTVPAGLWAAPLPRVALARDCHLLWHAYRRCLPACDLVLTDSWGADVLAREGIRQVRVANLCGCERSHVEAPPADGPRDVDVLLVGNLNAAVQPERMPWLARLARLGRRVLVRTGVPDDSYARLLARTRIVFQHSPRGKAGRRAFQAAAAGALVFQEEGNRELPAYFRDRQECVYYRPDNVEELLAHYLDHEEERRALAEAAQARTRHYRFEDFWEELLGRLEGEWPWRGDREPEGAADTERRTLWARCWQALAGTQYEDTTLLRDLERALKAEPDSAALCNAVGTVVARQAQGRKSAPVAAEVAAEYFRRALAAQPNHVLAGLNLAEALHAAGQRLGALEAARRTLEVLGKEGDPEAGGPDGLPFNHGFDSFRVEWERAGWANPGQPAAEARARRQLITWRLHTLLGRWTAELPYGYEAALLRPDLPHSRAALGVALARAGRSAEALPHLRQALAANPLDREVAFAAFQALGAVGDTEGRRRLVEGRRLLAQAVPAVVPREAWFAEPRPKGNELASVIVLCCNELEYTRRCLESVFRHTRAPYELILVDNGSTDGTPDYLEEVRTHAGPARVEVIRNETNRGFPAGCNQGLARAQGRYVVFLHNDTVVTAHWLHRLVAGSLHDWPRVGMVGPVTNNAPDAQRVPGRHAALEDLDAFAEGRAREFAGRVLPVRRLTGFCLLARREVLDRVGGFDERFGLGFFDDDDLCVRTREAGFQLLLALDAFVHHFGGRTFQALGIKTRESLEENFGRFQEKWGREYGVGYQLPPPAPAPAERSAAPTAPPADREEVIAASVTPPEGEAPAVPQVSSAAPAEPGIPPRVAVDGRIRVSLCMIVRNEEHHLPDCLRSVEDLFDEIVVADTGSTDRTREIAREFGARVFDFPWPDSFGAARNESLRHASGKWILWLDADDRLDPENRQKLKELLAGLGDELDAHALKVRSVLDANRSAFRLLDQVRLFRNLPEVRWDYRIHEQILPAVNRAGGNVRWADVVIDHVGYQDAGARRGKLERNLRLLELDHAERPEDAFTLFNLGWTLLDLGRGEEALAHLENALQRTSPSSSTLRKLYHLLAVTYRGLKRPDEALTRCRDGLRLFADDAELLCEEGLLARDQGDLAGAERSWLRLLDARRGQYFASEDVGLRGHRTRQLVAEVYRAQERLLEAEVQWRVALAENGAFEPAWQGLGELYVRQGRWSDLDDLLEKLEDQGVAPARLGWLRARGQIERKELAAARRTLQRVVAQDPLALGPRVLLSQVLLQEGRDWAAAERALRDVLALDPQHGETRHNLAVLLRRLGREAVPV